MLTILSFCERCGTKANESARFCSSCGLELVSAADKPEKANETAKRKNFRKWWALVITIFLSLATAVGLFVFPKVFQPDLIKFDEIKLVVGDSAYTWAYSHPRFKVALHSEETYYENVALHLEKQDSRGEWSSVNIMDVSRPGSFELNGESFSQPGEVVYRASIFQGERLVGSSEIKKVTFLPKKSDFTYVGRIGYRFFSEKEYDKSTCPAGSGCWKVHIVSRAKVRLEIKMVASYETCGRNAGKTLSKIVKVEIPNINKVQVVTIPSLFSSPGSGCFEYSEELLTAKDLKRIALAMRQKEEQNNSRPKPQPTKTSQIPSASAEQCFKWRWALAKDKETLSSYKPRDWYSWREWDEQTALAYALNSGDIGAAAEVARIIQNMDVLRQLINSRC